MLKSVVNIHRWGHGRRRGVAEPVRPGDIPRPEQVAADGAALEESERSAAQPVAAPEEGGATYSRVSAWLAAAHQGTLGDDAVGAHLDLELAGGSARRAEMTAVCSPFHSAEPGAQAVYHNSSKCSEGQRISAEHLVDGVGVDRSLCEECVSLTLGSWTAPSGESWCGPARG